MDIRKLYTELESSTNNIFDYVEVAEGIIKDRCERDPDNHDIIWNTFKHMCPTKKFMESDIKVFKYHCNCIIDNAIRGVDIIPTNGDVILAISQMTLSAPPNRIFSKAYKYLFNEIYTDNDINDFHIDEYEQNEIFDVIESIRKKL